MRWTGERTKVDEPMPRHQALTGDNDASTPPASPDPFVLIVGARRGLASPEAVEGAMRRIGLRPRPVVPGAAGAESADAPVFGLAFGSVAATAGRAAAAVLDSADPADSANSSLACALPAGWRGGDPCWIVRLAAPEGAPTTQAARIREFFKLVVLLVDLFEASHIYWSPARLWSDAPQFRAAVAEMLTSGMPPVLHLVAFRRRGAGAGETVATRGLALFGGQELEAEVPAGWTMADMVKRLARIALDVMLHGPVLRSQNARGLEAGEMVRLIPATGEDGAERAIRVEFGGRG